MKIFVTFLTLGLLGSALAQCDPGFGLIPGTGDECEECTAGHFSAGGGDSCAPCPSGEAALAAGESSCAPCGPGEEPSDDATECDDCLAGFASSDGRACVECLPGAISADHADGCAPCGPGSFANGHNTACLPCADGSSSLTGSDDCFHCPLGTISRPATDLPVCTSCDAGSGPNEEQDDCVECPGGTFSVDPDDAGPKGYLCRGCPWPEVAAAGSQNCVPCANNFYPNEEQDQCLACPDGSYNQDGITCLECPTGWVSTAGGDCTPCDDESGPISATSCGLCPAGEEGKPTSTHLGSTASGHVCGRCDEPMVSDSTGGRCFTCSSPYVNNLMADDCVECPRQEDSTTGDRLDCEPCAEGFITVDCPEGSGQCVPGCQPCTAGTGAYDKCLWDGVLSQMMVTGDNRRHHLDCQYDMIWSCELCPRGWFSSPTTGGGHVCEQCTFPQVTTSTGETSCRNCGEGFIAGHELASCDYCREGENSNADGSACEPCPEGTRTDNANRSEDDETAVCVPCQEDSTTDPWDATQCLPCPGGTEGQDTGDGTICVPCSETLVSNGVMCQLCEDGFIPNEDNDDCDACPCGYSSDPNDRTQCENCAEVYGPSYYREGSSGLCEQCPPGMIADEEGCGCTPCPWRSVRPSGQDDCTSCPPGSVVSDLPAVECTTESRECLAHEECQETPEDDLCTDNYCNTLGECETTLIPPGCETCLGRATCAYCEADFQCQSGVCTDNLCERHPLAIQESCDRCIPYGVDPLGNCYTECSRSRHCAAVPGAFCAPGGECVGLA